MNAEGAGGSNPRAARSPRAFRWAVAAVLAAAAALRLAHLGLVADAPFVAQLALDSQEYDRWAREIAAGDLLAQAPFFQAPLYPYLVALLYSLAGASPFVVYLAQIAVALAGCAALVAAGRRIGGDRLGLVAGSLFALYSPFAFYDVQLLKESFAVSLVAALLWLLVEARRGDRAGIWFAAGLAAGLVALLRENMLLVVPFLLPLAWRRTAPPERPAGALRNAALLVAGIALAILPAATANAVAGGGFLPTTSQGGVNFWIGNNPKADGTYRPLVPGKQIPRYEREEARRLAEQALGRALAAHEVSGYWLGRALEWARAEPASYARLQVRKVGLYLSGYEWPDAVDYYWMKSISPPLALPLVEFGAVALLAAAGLSMLAIGRRDAAAGTNAAWQPILLFELGWLLTTVAFFVFSRYRLPAVPGLILLAALPIVSLSDAWRSGRRRLALGAAAVLLLIFAAPHLTGYGPRRDLVEFNLGRLAEERGDAPAAEGHYRAALAADPASFSATLNLGNLAARRGDYAAAHDRFARAVEIAPDSDDAHANLGGAFLALGNREAARRELDLALELNPQNRFARHNRELLDRAPESR